MKPCGPITRMRRIVQTLAVRLRNGGSRAVNARDRPSSLIGSPIIQWVGPGARSISLHDANRPLLNRLGDRAAAASTVATSAVIVSVSRRIPFVLPKLSTVHGAKAGSIALIPRSKVWIPFDHRFPS